MELSFFTKAQNGELNGHQQPDWTEVQPQVVLATDLGARAGDKKN